VCVREIGDFQMNVTTLSVAALLLATGSTYAEDSLAELIAEAESNNAQVLAAEHSWRAATYVARQMTALPDPQFTLQQFSVGSPRPFAGFTNSNFAYIGFGASQELPYPGKLRLKGQVAKRQADTERAQAGALRASIAEQVKTAYFHLAYLQQTLTVLERSGATLKRLADSELSRYRVGQGSQADVLKAQLEHTKLLREITMHHAEMAEAQADLKLLLHREQESPDIAARGLTATTLSYSASELLALVRERNPAVQTMAMALKRQDVQLQSAEKGGKPDFDLGYMFQQTGDAYRDYYMLTFNMTLPRRQRIHAEIAEAAELQSRAKEELDAQLRQQRAEVQKQYAAASSAAELLTEYREGLIPQAEAAFRAELTAYESNKEQLSGVLVSLNEMLSIEREREQALLDREIAIARLETLTGAILR
jgi:outer membrane protein TolC